MEHIGFVASAFLLVCTLPVSQPHTHHPSTANSERGYRDPQVVRNPE